MLRLRPRHDDHRHREEGISLELEHAPIFLFKFALPGPLDGVTALFTAGFISKFSGLSDGSVCQPRLCRAFHRAWRVQVSIANESDQVT